MRCVNTLHMGRMTETKGSLLLAWQVKDKHCLVIGAGDVALSRIHHLIIAQAKVTVVTGISKDVHPEILDLNAQGKIHKLIQRNYQSEDLQMYETASTQLDYTKLALDDFKEVANLVNESFACVCCCIDDYALSTKIYYQCKLLRLPVNIADKPPLCDFYFGSMINQDNLQIMISTNGKSPRLSKLIKDNIARQFSGVDVNKAIENLGLIRSRLRELILIDDDLVTIDARMSWIKELTDFYTIKQWSSITLTSENTDSPYEKVDKIVKCFPEYPPCDFVDFVKFIDT